LDGGAELVGDGHGRQDDAGQVARVAVARAHRGRQGRVARPQAHVVAVAGQGRGGGSGPRPGAEPGDPHGAAAPPGPVLVPVLAALAPSRRSVPAAMRARLPRWFHKMRRATAADAATGARGAPSSSPDTGTAAAPAMEPTEA